MAKTSAGRSAKAIISAPPVGSAVAVKTAANRSPRRKAKRTAVAPATPVAPKNAHSTITTSPARKNKPKNSPDAKPNVNRVPDAAPSITASNLTSSGTASAPFLAPVGALTVDDLKRDGVFHAVARCRWCGGRFERIYGWQWICETRHCAERMIDAAMFPHERVLDGSPFLFLPLPLQVDIDEHPAKRLLVLGPAGISKSFGSRWHLYKRCRKYKGYQALLLRCTLEQLRTNHLEFMKGEAEKMGDARYVGGNEKRMYFDNGAMIKAGYCDSADDIEGHLGNEYDEIMIEQAEQFLDRAINEITTRDRGSAPARPTMAALGIYEGRSRLLSNRGGRADTFLDEHYIDRTPDPVEYPNYNPIHYAAITGDVRDNPYLSETFKSSVMGGLDHARYQQLAEGDRYAVRDQFFHWRPNA